MKNILDRNQNKAIEVRNLLLLKKVLMVNYNKLSGCRKNYSAGTYLRSSWAKIQDWSDLKVILRLIAMPGG